MIFSIQDQISFNTLGQTLYFQGYSDTCRGREQIYMYAKPDFIHTF